MICGARRGFLTLSDCGDPAATMCTNCGRPMCAAHLSAQSGFTMCLDCTATQPQEGEAAEGEAEYDDVWAHRYRDDYYRTSAYTPAGSSAAHYDSHDTSSFAARQDDFAEEESEGADFGDS